MIKNIQKKWAIFIVVSLGIFMSTLDSSIVNLALPYIMQDLATRLQVIQWVVLIYLLTISSLLLTFGRLSDIKGRRVIYCSGFIIFSTGSLCCAAASTPLALILSRAVQGCGASMLMACSPAIIVDTFPEEQRGRALGMIGAVVAAGLTAGPVAGGLILDHFSWRFIFYLNLPIGIVATLAGASLLKNSEADSRNDEPLDKSGSICLIISLCCMLLVMTHFNQWGIFSKKTILVSLCFFAATVFFIRIESKTTFPLFDPELLKIRLFVMPVISSVILFAALFIIIFMMPFYLVHPCGFSASATGFVMITPFIFLFFISPVAGSLYNLAGSRRLCATGMLLLCSSLLALSCLGARATLFSIVWRLALAGTGTALFISPNSTAAMNAIPANRRGIASGSVATARNLGMVLGVALAGLIFSTSFSRLSGGLQFKEYTPFMEPFFMAGFRNTMAAGFLLALAGIAVSFLRGDDKPGNR